MSIPDVPERHKPLYGGVSPRPYIYTTISCGEDEDPCPICGEELVQDVRVDRAGTQEELGEPYCEDCLWPLSPCCGAEVIEDYNICSQCKEHI